MAEYIARDDAVHIIFIAATSGRTAPALKMLRERIVTDLVEVTRCKDCVKKDKCMLYSEYRYPFFDEDFCSYGWDGEEEC